MMKSIAIYTRQKQHGTINNVIMPNNEVLKEINKKLKINAAKLLVDNEEILMYELQ